MSSFRTDAIGLAILRIVNGIFLFTHGLLKVIYFPPTGTMKFFELFGLPGQTAYLLIAAEIVLGALLVSGFFTRIAAFGGMVILLGATIPHAGNGFVFSNPGGGWEYPLFWAACLLALALMSGRCGRDRAGVEGLIE